MLARVFHAWEHRLVSVSKDRVVRPFEWGQEWIPSGNQHTKTSPQDAIEAWSSRALEDSSRFFGFVATTDYSLDDGEHLTFPSTIKTPHPENNLVHARYFPAAPPLNHSGKTSRAVIVLPQWNADPDGHVGLCRLLSRFGMSALRLSLPYHDKRMPPELTRADYIVSSNVARTLQVCRQAVIDTRLAAAWLHKCGYTKIGILGTSLGSCLALLTAAHEPLIQTMALNHISPYFADVVWKGLSTAHIQKSFEGQIELDVLRRLWMPISPASYLDRIKNKRILLVYAKYDLTFPVELSQQLIREFNQREIPHKVGILPCGHYSTGVAPFKWLDAWFLIRFLAKNL